MLGVFFWIVLILVIVLVAIGAYAVGTRARVNTGGYCEVDTHWWFGWWVRCVGGERCESGECRLQLRMKGTENNWGDAGVVPGGSVKWNKHMEYRCTCND